MSLHSTDLLVWEDNYESLDAYQEAEGVYNNGEYIADQFLNGNWRDGAQNLLDIRATPVDFARFVDEESREGFMYDSLNREAFVCIADLYTELRTA